MRWSWFLAAGSTGVVAYLLVPAGVPRIAVYAAVTTACVLAFGFGGHHRHEINRRSWQLLLLGLTSWAVGDLVTGIRLLGGDVVPIVSSADAAYLLGHGLVVAGLLSIRDERGRVFHIQDVLEGLIVATGLGLTAWIFVVGTKTYVALGVESFSLYWPVVAYASADGFLASLMIVVLLSKRARTVPFAFTGMALLAVSASGWAMYTAVDTLRFRELTYVSAGWLVGYVLLTSAALYPARKLWAAREGSLGARRIVDRARLTGLSIAALMSPAVMGIQLARGIAVAEWGWVVFGASVVAVVLVAARMACFLSVLRKQADALTVAAVSDPVTGLANRRHLGELLELLIVEAEDDGVIVFIVDIDRFAQINETFGYPVGDRVLRRIGQRLRSAATTDSVVGRLGGDQFVVSMTGKRMPGTALECAELFLTAVSRTMFVRDINVALDATVGVVQSSDLVDVDAECLLQHAHVALTAAKHGHARASVYLPYMDSDRHDQMRLLGELETALRERQLRVFFQPCLNLHTRKVSGVEALLRWQHPREGLIAPCLFLPDAERTGMLPAITAYVLEGSLECCSTMRARRPDFGVSVNLSVRNLLDPTLVDQVSGALQRHDVPATAVEFEITETTAMTDPRRSVDSLVALRDMGVTVAIDDYGTGYSSLAYLRTLPVQTLKIDKSFVTAMNTQPTNSSIVGSTIELARSLGMTVVAEGVEDAETLVRLRDLGCDGAQGFHIGRPVPPEELEALVERIETELDPCALEWGSTISPASLTRTVASAASRT
ncbi:MAG: bifunctional diguanylate cyclase/phosphodiesterase [Rhodococcus sp. (in: high G+C Gram-positive bacteria)]